MTNLITFVQSFVATRMSKDERGASLVEYALLVALIAAVCILAITALGTNANDTFNSVSDSIANA